MKAKIISDDFFFGDDYIYMRLVNTFFSYFAIL